MKLTNKQIYWINNVFNEICNEEMNAKLAFKLFKIKKKLENEMDIIQESLRDREDNEKEVNEVLDMENEIDIENIKASELEELKLSMQDVFYLEAIIDFEEEENE